MTCAIEEFTAFLVQFLGGPSADSQRRWWLSLRESHLRFRIGPTERAAWMKNMIATLEEMPVEEHTRAALRGFFEHSSAYIVNQGEISPPRAPIAEDLDRRWEVQRALDEAVAAARIGETERAIALVERQPNRSIRVGFLLLLIRGGNESLLAYVEKTLTADPSLVHERYGGFTLLNEAAAQGNLALVNLLLRLGADLNAGRHPSLYCLANGVGGGDVVHALVKAGAVVDDANNVKRCTALHMAARRGNVEIADALLDCGADIEARDIAGETPLRRAVNCGKTEVAALLLRRGADPRSRCKRGLTPIEAARTEAMKRLFRRTK